MFLITDHLLLLLSLLQIRLCLLLILFFFQTFIYLFYFFSQYTCIKSLQIFNCSKGFKVVILSGIISFAIPNKKQ